jgi:threonine dehydrogenase-like Zn-dependent dehydrogenase
MRAFRVSVPGRHAVLDLPRPRPAPGEALIAPEAVGICGSDLDLVSGRRPPGFVAYPVVPGHEWSGRVVALGTGVHGIELGAPVVAEGVRCCAQCERCKQGRTNLCAGPYAETGFTHPGALAEVLTVPAALIHRLPPDRPLAPAALLEPAACVANALLEAGAPPPGCRLAVVGDGPLALVAASLLRAHDPRETVVFGLRPDRCERALAVGATGFALGATGLEADWRGRFDLVVEATDSRAGALAALRLARRGGTVLLLGISGSGRAALDPDLISLGQLRVQGGFSASPAAWDWTVARYASGDFDPAGLITHRFPLERTADALDLVARRTPGAVKVIVLPNTEC